MPNIVIACIGALTDFVLHEEAALIVVEAGGQGIDTDKHVPTKDKDQVVIISVSRQSEKDVGGVRRYLKEKHQ